MLELDLLERPPVVSATHIFPPGGFWLPGLHSLQRLVRVALDVLHRDLLVCVIWKSNRRSPENICICLTLLLWACTRRPLGSLIQWVGPGHFHGVCLLFRPRAAQLRLMEWVGVTGDPPQRGGWIWCAGGAPQLVWVFLLIALFLLFLHVIAQSLWGPSSTLHLSGLGEVTDKITWPTHFSVAVYAPVGHHHWLCVSSGPVRSDHFILGLQLVGCDAW